MAIADDHDLDLERYRFGFEHRGAVHDALPGLDLNPTVTKRTFEPRPDPRLHEDVLGVDHQIAAVGPQE